jgi:Domain of unknown function (DUF4234)
MSIVLENLRRDTRARLETDKHMSTAWIIVPILPFIGFVIYLVVIVATNFTAFSSLRFTNTTSGPTSSTTTTAPMFAVGFLGLLALFYVVLFVVGILFAVLLYKLVKRRNTHFHRQMFLYDDLIALAKELGTRKGIDISIQLNNLDRTSREVKVEETEKSAALWAILSLFIGILSYYVYYFQMKDFYKHERRQDIFLDDLSKLMTTAGIPVNLPRNSYPIPDRSFILYLILAIITAGLFNIYWIYTLISDPNNHFRHQALLEDTIMAQVTPQFG